MAKTILITGATDGIGLETAKRLTAGGHTLLIHGRNGDKLNATADQLSGIVGAGRIAPFKADLSDLSETKSLAASVRQSHPSIDVLLNNAGVFKTPRTTTAAGLDVRFVVNTIAPYLLATELLPAMGSEARVVNVSSAAQARVNPQAMRGEIRLSDMDAYSQSKLAIALWTFAMAQRQPSGPAFIAVNPGSLLASKMVKDGFGVAGNDIGIGANILIEAALSDRFAKATGRYFDNDSGQFAALASPDIMATEGQRVIKLMDEILAKT